MKSFVFGLLWFLIPTLAISQVFYVQSPQPPTLQARAGDDAAIVAGQSVLIGGNPAAINGYGQYTYLWSPSEGLFGITEPNPVARPERNTTYQLIVTDQNNCIAMDEVTVTVQPSGKEEFGKKMRTNIFPNPAHDDMTILIEDTGSRIDLKLINTLGQVCLIKSFEVQPVIREVIDLKSLPRGFYLVLLQTEKESIKTPVIIQ